MVQRMSPTLEKLRDEIRHLPIGERMRFVKGLEDDLDADALETEDSLAELWDAEERTRVDEIMTGDVELVSQDELDRRLDEIRARYVSS